MGAGYYDGRALANRWCLLVWFLSQGLWDVNFQVDGLTSGKDYAIGQASSREVMMGSSHPFNPLG